jgi:hypothetical protein
MRGGVGKAMQHLSTEACTGVAQGGNTPVLARWRHPAILVASGCAALALGLLVYASDRGAMPGSLWPTAGAVAGRHFFGPFGQWLPSFVHTFAFALFTAAALAPSTRPRYGACLAWGAVNVAFEIGQHPRLSARLADLLQISFGDAPTTQALARYFVHGTFDPGDIVAALLGSLAAAAVLRINQEHREHQHAN